MVRVKKYRCPFCPDGFSTVEKYDMHFQSLHRVDRFTGRVQGYREPLPYSRPKREKPPLKDDLDGLFSWGQQDDFDQEVPDNRPPPPPVSPF